VRLPAGAGRVLGPLLRLWSRTLRLSGTLHDGSGVDPIEVARRPEIFALCERDAFGLCGLLSRARFLALVAHGPDGDWATAAARSLGCEVVRGATRRAGLQGLAELVARLSEWPGPAVLLVDGPVGPCGVAQPGALVCASASGRPVRPVAAAARRAVVLRGAWSQIWLPWPGSRVAAVAGEPLHVPPGIARAEAALLAGELSRRLAGARERALAAVGRG
jgi:lysophospholipid acyltransferase (LPLAT)-like uncharacterized protein